MNPDFAWFVGVFEGEGCITLQRGRPNLQIAMTDGDIIHRIREVTGVGSVFVSTREKRHRSKPMWHWSVSRQWDAVELLLRMLPLLGDRRTERALHVLEAYWIKQGQRAQLPTYNHGTRACYWAGCKCADCRAANARYERERRAAS